MTRNTDIALTAGEIAEILDAEISGDKSVVITGTEFIERATASDLAFVGCRRNIDRISESAAQVIIAPRDVADDLPESASRTFLFVNEPENAFLSIAQKLAPARAASRVGISSNAFIANSARLGRNATIHPFAHIGEDVIIGEDCIVGPGASIGDDCRIGDNARIDANAVVYPGVVLGDDVVLNSGAVIGAEGFGYQTVDGRHKRLPHVGNVVIHDDVEIGACTTIDRAKMGSTVVGTGTRIDNQVMIGHNCQIGDHNLLVSQAGLAGSCSTGSYVVLAGQVGVADHVHLGDGAIVGAKSGVHRDMPGGQAYLGSPATPAGEQAKIVTSLRRLPQMRKTIKELEAKVESLQAQLAEVLSALPNENSTEREAA